MLEVFTQWDVHLFFLINKQWTSPWLDLLMPAFSDPRLLWTAAALVLAYKVIQGLRRKEKKLFRRVLSGLALLALCLAATNTLTDIVKDQAGRIRPHHALPFSRYLEAGRWEQHSETVTVQRKRGSSFFSGHAANSMALVVGVGALYPPALPLLYLLPFSVGYSRVYLGKHYPSDVAAGWVAGWCTASLLCFIVRRTNFFKRIFRQQYEERGSL